MESDCRPQANAGESQVQAGICEKCSDSDVIDSMAATGPAVTLLRWSFRASQQTKPNVSSATPASRPTSQATRSAYREMNRSEAKPVRMEMSHKSSVELT